MSPVLTFILSLAACGSDGTASPFVPATPEAPVVTPAAAAVAAPDHESGPHAHSSAHGGIVQAVDGLHIEALMMPGGVMFYLADQAQKPLPVDGYAGNAVIRGPSGIVTVELMPMGDHLHAAAALLQGQPATAVLTLTHEGKAVSATFETATVGCPIPHYPPASIPPDLPGSRRRIPPAPVSHPVDFTRDERGMGPDRAAGPNSAGDMGRRPSPTPRGSERDVVEVGVRLLELDVVADAVTVPVVGQLRRHLLAVDRPHGVHGLSEQADGQQGLVWRPLARDQRSHPVVPHGLAALS